MTDPRQPLFDYARKLSLRAPGPLVEADVTALHHELDLLGAKKASPVAAAGLAGAAGAGLGVPVAPSATTPQSAPTGPLTARVALELVGHEAIVPEAYKDSVGVWTWGVGVTNASGHSVDRYKDNPQPLKKCLEVYIWLLRERYIPDVLAAFAGRELTEAQFCAALSFHYNTGAIKRAGWVRSFMAGRPTEAKQQIMEWNKPKEILGRRGKERDLFFDGKWSSDGKATVYPVRKPSYAPNWGGAQRVDIRADVEALL